MYKVSFTFYRLAKNNFWSINLLIQEHNIIAFHLENTLQRLHIYLNDRHHSNKKYLFRVKLIKILSSLFF